MDEIRRGMAEMTGSDADHLTRVLRVEPGQQYEISDNRSVHLARVTVARRGLVQFEMADLLPPEPPRPPIVLYPSLIKFDSFEWMIEKATELGVTTIQPVIATRSEHGVERAAVKRVDRWRKIALEASQQSRRDHLPELHLPISFQAALNVGGATIGLFCDEEIEGTQPVLAASTYNAHVTRSVLIGPEGGWTKEERVQATAAHWIPVSLGPTILRAETAALAALAILNAVLTPQTE